MSEQEKQHDLSRLRIDRTPGAPTPRPTATNRRKLIITVGIIALTIILWRMVSSGRAGQPTSASQSGIPAVPHTASPPVRLVLNATGYVVAQRKAAVSSKATGRLTDLLVREGDTVKKDQVIGILEHADLKALVNQNDANLRSLQAQVKGYEAGLRDAERSYARTRSLRKQGVSAQSEMDVSEARLDKARADLEASRAAVMLAQAQLEKAKVELNYSYIRAPFDGTVLTKDADVGEIVAPFGSSANARAAIVTIADMESLQVEADVAEANIAKVYVGQPVAVTLDSVPEKTYHGVVDKIVPTVDRAKATVLTKIRFTDLDDHVIPEMSAKIAFTLKAETP